MPYKDNEYRKEYDRQRHRATDKNRHTPEQRRVKNRHTPEQQRGYQRAYNAQRKLKVLSHYGPGGHLRCSWPDCIVDDIDMLTLDHIYNDGAESRKTLRADEMYAWLVRNNFPEGNHQTLCWNHQWKKEILRRRKL